VTRSTYSVAAAQSALSGMGIPAISFIRLASSSLLLEEHNPVRHVSNDNEIAF
jgi:hypothetical protein